MTGLGGRLAGLSRRYLAERRGSSALEFALWALALTVPILSAVDVGAYSYQDMQLNNAAQAAAQAAWETCGSVGLVPAVSNCPGLQTALATAAQSTGLGTSAVLQTSSEGFYCLDASENLQLVGTAGSIAATPTGTSTAPTPPTGTCAAQTAKNGQGPNFTGNNNAPGDYVLITVQYTYTPVFGGLSVLSLLPTTMSRTAWMRLA